MWCFLQIARITEYEQEERVFGRGNRTRKEVDYSDALTDRQFLRVRHRLHDITLAVSSCLHFVVLSW